MKITFFVDAVPVPQPRHRVGPGSKGGRPRAYLRDDHSVHVFKQIVQIRARQAHQGEPLAGPLKVSLLFLMPRPARLVWKNKPMDRMQAAVKPDVDNCAKSVYDALNGLLWNDDGQITWAVSYKLYHAGDESPGVQVEVESLS